MEYEILLNNARWDIIKSISKRRSSATEIAKNIKSSLPNISQQIKLLEAYDILEYTKDQKKTIGKPRRLYQLKREFCQLTFARHGFAERRFFTPDSYHTLLLNILFLPNLQDHVYLHKLLLENEEVTKHCSIAFLKSNEHEIELFLITEEIDLIRNKYSNTFVEHHDKQKKVIAWTHTLHEINDGLRKKEPYFEHLVQNPQIIHDPKSQFEKIKKEKQ